mgnify:CR=1 FL=1
MIKYLVKRTVKNEMLENSKKQQYPQLEDIFRIKL